MLNVAQFILIIFILIILIVIYFWYEKSIYNINPRVIIFSSYMLLVIYMSLATISNILSLSFLPFILVAITFYDHKIDSRFLIYPSIFLIGYIPFCLFSNQQYLAKYLTIYTFFFLLTGVLLQFIEFVQGYGLDIRFRLTGHKFDFKIPMIIMSMLIILFISFNRLYNVNIVVWTLIYLLLTILFLTILESDKFKFLSLDSK